MPYKKIFAVGDSFTRGDELSDCDYSNELYPHEKYSLSTWPSLIAKELDVDYECRATGGRGNTWINWTVNQIIPRSEDCLVIVNWSYFGRFDYLDLEDHWTTITPNHLGQKEKEYYQRFDNDLWNLNRNLQLMYSTFSMLKNSNIDFISTCQDSSFKQTVDTLRSVKAIACQSEWRIALEPLINFVVPEIIEFEGFTFRQWSGKHGYPIGPGGHPLEKAHVEAAKYINMVTTEGKRYGH